MASTDRFCLRVRNLPAVLSPEAVTSLLAHYGAARVHVLQRRNASSSGKEPGTASSKKTQKAVAVFATREAQQNAQRRLHALELAGHHLQVEMVGDEESSVSEQQKGETGNRLPLNGPPPLPKGPPPPLPPTPTPGPMQNSMYTPAPLAPHLGLNYAPSPLLEYKYPRATESIVRNIANALIALPRFYTQVLHLMNKMNLPPPFDEDAIPGRFSVKQEKAKQANELRERQRRQLKRPRNNDIPIAQIVEEEEEEEDSIGDVGDQGYEEGIDQHEPAVETHRPSKKLQLSMAPRGDAKYDQRQPDVSVRPESVGSQPAIIGKSLMRQNKRSVISSAGLDAAFQLGDETTVDKRVHRAERPGVISEIELNRLQVSPEGLRQEPLMTSYERGAPSRVVLVQNIARAVDEKDLRSVFGYVLPLNLALESMGITFLSVEGSALVRYPDEEAATAAVDKLHGILLEGNPLIVSFHRAAIAEGENLDITKKISGAQYWTTQDLANKRIHHLQLAAEKAMKKYERGEPSDTLYAKNLAKSVQLSDLVAVFGAVLPPASAPETLEIRHFTTGRMKCQAFVKYPTIEFASKALQQVHGVVLKDKPIIVCFRKPKTDQK